MKKIKKLLKFLLFIIGFNFIPAVIIFNYFPVYGIEQIDIKLKDEVMVSSSVITIGDIAEIRCSEEELKKKISDVIIANSPTPLKIRAIKDSYILNRLKHKKFNVDKIKLSGSKEVIVSITVKEITEEKIYDVAKKYLKKQLSYKSENHEISFKRRIKSIYAPSNKLHIDVIERRIGMLKGLLHLSVGIYNGQKLYKVVSVPLKIRVFENVVLSNKDISPDDVINENDLLIERRETTTSGKDVIYKIEDAIGKQPKNNIKKGDIFKSNMLRDVPLLERGRFVTIKVIKGNIVVTTPGKAMQNGSLNDYIKVLNLSSNEQIVAQIDGSTSVIIR